MLIRWCWDHEDINVHKEKCLPRSQDKHLHSKEKLIDILRVLGEVFSKYTV